MLDYLLNNWPLKLLSLALAFAIWVGVTGEERVLRDLTVPLEIALAKDRVPPVGLASATPNTVLVRLRGAQSVMRRLDPIALSVSIDMSDAAPGAHEVQLVETDVLNVPGGIEVELIEPDRLKLDLEEWATVSLPVVVTVDGQPPEGFHYYGAVAFPNTMRVEGPRSEVEKLEELRTSPIPLNLRTQTDMDRASVVVEGNFVRMVNPQELQVRVDVDVAPSVRKLEGVPVELLGASPGSQASPDRIDVTLSGPPSLLDRVLPEQIRVVADASGLLPSRQAHEVELRAELPGVPAGDLFFLVVGTDGAGTESSWGVDSLPSERNGMIHSGECSTISKEISTSCP